MPENDLKMNALLPEFHLQISVHVSYVAYQHHQVGPLLTNVLIYENFLEPQKIQLLLLQSRLDINI